MATLLLKRSPLSRPHPLRYAQRIKSEAKQLRRGNNSLVTISGRRPASYVAPRWQG